MHKKHKKPEALKTLKQPAVLIIRDGWGANHNSAHNSYNAVALANTPVADAIAAENPRCELVAHGPEVGLPPGVMGNSEVGHQNIGAGRIVNQELMRINAAFETGEIANNPTLKAAIAHIEKTGGKLHLMGLLSDAGVHAMLTHLKGLLAHFKNEGLGKKSESRGEGEDAEQANRVFLHAFTDGRDTAPTAAAGFIKTIEADMQALQTGAVATVSGRFWAMDRDLRWERVQKAYSALTCKDASSAALTATSAQQAIAHAHSNPVSESQKGDEFVLPTVIVNEATAAPIGPVSPGDAAIFFNYRSDRPRELTRAFIEENFEGFARGKKIENLFFATFTNYEAGLCKNIVFPKPPPMVGTLGEAVSATGLGQFRCAETEKFPHVTFFFNNTREEPYPGEVRSIAPSPKDVSTYDEKPEMSAAAVCKATKDAIESGKYGLIVVNFANPDMVGHTGNLPATIQACEVVDACVGQLITAAKKAGAAIVVTADHGNADQLLVEDTNKPHTAHTLNPVELVVVNAKGAENMQLNNGKLGDIAPTLLHLMGLEKPAEMTGQSLIV